MAKKLENRLAKQAALWYIKSASTCDLLVSDSKESGWKIISDRKVNG